MLSKMMPGVTKNHSVARVSRKKQQPTESQDSNDDITKSDEIQNSKSGSNGCSNGVNSNWAKFRSVVSQQAPGAKNPTSKRQHPQTTKSWREKHKARRMVLPRFPCSVIGLKYFY